MRHWRKIALDFWSENRFLWSLINSSIFIVFRLCKVKDFEIFCVKVVCFIVLLAFPLLPLIWNVPRWNQIIFARSQFGQMPFHHLDCFGSTRGSTFPPKTLQLFTFFTLVFFKIKPFQGVPWLRNWAWHFHASLSSSIACRRVVHQPTEEQPNTK